MGKGTARFRPETEAFSCYVTHSHRGNIAHYALQEDPILQTMTLFIVS
jgi:hypothetical protein